jgi:hypothetical protein
MFKMSLNFPIGRTVKLECEQCNNKYDYDIELTHGNTEQVASYDRKMGPEIQYESDIFVNCKNCNDLIETKLDIWEYPIGTIHLIE